MKATRKPPKGGLSNALFVQAAVEDLPPELDAIANEIYINFPWGSLLRAVVTGDEIVLTGIRRAAAPNCRLEIVIGLDVDRDRSEIRRLELPQMDDGYIQSVLVNKYRAAGFEILEARELRRREWSRLETSWARKLSPSGDRRVRYFKMRAI
jgi:16S rRNA (adenine(1408)-N(1))-methyltransferase